MSNQLFSLNNRKENSYIYYCFQITRKKIKALDVAEMDINNEEEFDGNSPYILKDR